MNTFKTQLLRSILVFGFFAFTMVSAFSSTIIEEDLMRVASDSGCNIESVTVENQETGETQVYRLGSVTNECEIDISGLEDGCYIIYLNTADGLEELGAGCKFTRE